METILDHNMTEEERYELIGTRSDERFLHCLDENSSNLFLAELYLLRNDEKKMIPQFGITECFIQYKCSVKTPPPHTIRSG